MKWFLLKQVELLEYVCSITLQTLAFRWEEAEPPRYAAGSQLFLYLPQESSVLRFIPFFFEMVF